MEEKKIHPLQAARKRLGIKQTVLADLTGLSVPTIKRAEAGEPLSFYSVSQICEFFSRRYKREIDAQELGLQTQWANEENSTATLVQEQPQVTLNQTPLILIKNLLESPQFLDKLQSAIIQNIASTTNNMLLQSPGMSQQAERRNTSISEEQIAFLESVMLTQWNSYYTGKIDSILHSLSFFLNEIERSAQAAQGTHWHHQTLRLLALGYQLQNCILRDCSNHQQANIAYQKAFNIAQELNDPELLASALARQGVALVQQTKSQQAVLYLDNALNIIEGQNLPRLRGYALQALSEASAQNHQERESWLYLDQAEKIIIESEPEQSFIRFNPKTVSAQRGIDAVFLKSFKNAIDLIDQSLKTYDPTGIKGRARLIASKAEAYYELGIVEACTENAHQAIALARSVGSDKIISRIEKLYTNLDQSRWKQESEVIQLKNMLYNAR